MKRIMAAFCIVTVTMAVVGCMSSKSASSSGKGGEVVGVGGRSFSEPSPYRRVCRRLLDGPDRNHQLAIQAVRALGA